MGSRAEQEARQRSGNVMGHTGQDACDAAPMSDRNQEDAVLELESKLIDVANSVNDALGMIHEIKVRNGIETSRRVLRSKYRELDFLMERRAGRELREGQD